MASYVPGFQYDIFVSYAHGDDPEWIGKFHKLLVAALRQQLGVEPKIFFDKDALSGSQDYRREIPQSLSRSALLILLTSNHYLKSSYCVQKECPGFKETILAKRERFKSCSFENELFAFRISILPSDRDEHLLLFHGATDYKFHDGNFPLRPIRIGNFEREFQRLVKDVTLLLKKMYDHCPGVFLYPRDPTQSTTSQTGRTTVIITMRSDYLGPCAEFRGLPERLNDSQYLVPRLTREQRRQAIEGPLGRVDISPRLVQQLLNDIGDEPDRLPVLQHTLMRVWQSWKSSGGDDCPIDLRNYQATGGIAGALDQHASELLRGLSEPIARTIFQRLTAITEKRPRRDPALLRELYALCRAETAGGQTEVREVLDRFRLGEATFLTPRYGELHPETPIDISHESVMWHWRKLRDEWMPAEHKAAFTFQRLIERAAGWRKGGPVLMGLDLADAVEWRSPNLTPVWAHRYASEGALEEVLAFIVASERAERDRQRKARRSFIIAAGLACLFAALALFAWSQSRRAKAAQVAADRSANWARSNETLAEQAEHAADRSASLAKRNQETALLAERETRQSLFNLENVTEQEKMRELSAFAAQSQAEDPAQALYLGLRTSRFPHPLPPGLKEVLAASLTKGASLGLLEGHLDTVVDVTWSPDGKTLASASADRTIRVWDSATGQTLRTLKGHEDQVSSVAWSPDGKTLASASSDTTIRLWNPASGQMLRTLRGHEFAVTSVAWSPDGKTLASAGDDNTVRLWDSATGQPLRTLWGHEDTVWSVVWSPDGATLASAGEDNTIRLWNAATGQWLRTLQGHTDTVWSVAWSPDGKTLASVSSDDTIRLWDAVSGRSRTMQGRQYGERKVAWNPDGKTLASSGWDNTIRLWDPVSGEVLRILWGHQNVVPGLAWNHDGRILASASADHSVRLWDVRAGQPLRALPGHTDSVWSVAWSPDGRTLASASSDNTIRLWDRASGRSIRTLEGHRDKVNSVAWSPDGEVLASASADSTVWLWEAATGQPLRTLEGHQDAVTSVAWSPDGKILASASSDGTIRLWQVANSQTPQVLTGRRYGATASTASTAWPGVPIVRLSPPPATTKRSGYGRFQAAGFCPRYKGTKAP